MISQLCVELKVIVLTIRKDDTQAGGSEQLSEELIEGRFAMQDGRISVRNVTVCRKQIHHSDEYESLVHTRHDAY